MDDFLGDSHVLDVTGFTVERLEYAMKLASRDSAYGYRVDMSKENPRLILYSK